MAAPLSRRNFLDRALQISLAGLLVGSAGAVAAADKVCADLNAMDSGASSMRISLNYVEISADATETCLLCAFFQAAANGCGTCQIFSGPANGQGHCDSWSRKG